MRYYKTPRKRKLNDVIDFLTKKPLVSKSLTTITVAEEPKEPFMNWTVIEDNGISVNKKFHRKENRVVFQVEHDLSSNINIMDFKNLIDNSYEKAMNEFLRNYDPNDFYSAYIEIIDPSKETNAIYIAPQKISLFDKERFLNAFYRVAQSNNEFLNNGLLKVRAITYKQLHGGGRSKTAPKTCNERIKSSKSIVSIKNNDNSCGYIAIAIGIQYHELNIKINGSRPRIGQPQDIKTKCQRWHNLISLSKCQNQEIREFKIKLNEYLRSCDKSDITNEELNMDILRNKVQPYLKGQYQVIVFDKDGQQLYVGDNAKKVIFLLHNENHFDLIKEVTSLQWKNYYCKECNKYFNQPDQHMCKDGCKKCRAPEKCQLLQQVDCKDCNVIFYSHQCFLRHLEFKVCKYIKYCEICETNYKFRNNFKHVCFEYKCKLCSEYYSDQPHCCYLKPLKVKKLEEEDSKNNIIVAFDIESELIKEGTVIRHQPVFLAAKVVCNHCKIDKSDCEICGEFYLKFEGQDCVKEFNDYLIKNLAKKAQKTKSNITVVAHNFSGYDGQWILRDICSRNLKNPTPIFNGTKIMLFDVGNIRYIDSCLLFQRPLAELPKMFDIEEETKGFFPHYLNKQENYENNYRIGDISKDMFGYKQMSIKRSQEFDQWYQLNKDKIINLREEMEKYCKSDVSILLKSLMKFRELFKLVTGLDPITRTFTLASIGLEFFRAKILKEKSIGITPVDGYHNNRKQSDIAKAWLDIMEGNYGTIIREYRLGPYYLDGYSFNFDINKSAMSRGTAFEFLGCYYHGCDCKSRHYNRELQEKVEQRKAYFQRHNIQFVIVKECEWMYQLDNDPILREKFEERKLYHRNMEFKHAIPRKALHGGRTNNVKFFHIASEGEKIMYLDFTSLYPYVLSRNVFPFGHPLVITKNYANIKDYFGFISCKVLPPKDLYLPVLPYSFDGKLLFPLCRTCAENKNNGSCTCSDDDRCLINTFTSIELQKAEELGYKVIEIYEVLHYEKQDDTTFGEYIKTWYKIKAEASGWPNYYQTEEQKQQYLSDFSNKEGINLEFEKISPNAGLRNIAKLMLNSLWGKLAQRPNQPQTVIVNSYHQLWDLLLDESKEKLAEEDIGESILFSYREKDESKANPGNTAVAIACFVTAYARLKLYSEMEKIKQDRLLYYDTDSIIFVYKEGEYIPNIANFLGEMTDEIEGEYGVGAKMTEFYTIGPKCYSYKVLKSDGTTSTKYKTKGISQTVESSEVCNFEEIKNKALTGSLDQTMVPQIQFRTNKQHHVSTHHINKALRVTSDKRRIVGNETLPYGYVDKKSEDEMDTEDFAQ